MDKWKIKTRGTPKADSLLPPTRRFPTSTAQSERKKEKKWSIGGFFKRISSVRDSDSSSQEENVAETKKRSTTRRKSKNPTARSKPVSDQIILHPLPKDGDTSENPPEISTDRHSINSQESPQICRDSLNSRSSDGSIDGPNRRLRKGKMKARVEAKRDKLCAESSSDEDSHKSSSSLVLRLRSDDSAQSSQRSEPCSRRTRNARTERYIKRLSREEIDRAAINGSQMQKSHSECSDVNNDLEKSRPPIHPRFVVPQTKSQTSTYPAHKTPPCSDPPGAPFSSFRSESSLVNNNDTFINRNSLVGQHNLPLKDCLSQSLERKLKPPEPPPRDPQRRVLSLGSYDGGRPNSYAFDGKPQNPHSKSSGDNLSRSVNVAVRTPQSCNSGDEITWLEALAPPRPRPSSVNSATTRSSVKSYRSEPPSSQFRHSDEDNGRHQQWASYQKRFADRRRNYSSESESSTRNRGLTLVSPPKYGPQIFHRSLSTEKPVVSSLQSPPPEPPIRQRVQTTSTLPLDDGIDAEASARKRNSRNLEDALSELEAIYNSLRLGDEDLLERAERAEQAEQAERRESKAEERSSSQRKSDVPDRIKDDMAYRRMHPKDRPSSLDGQASLSKISYLIASPVLSRKNSQYLDPKQRGKSDEPDITRDDVVYRSINYANNKLRVVEPQPPFGIPLGPVTSATDSDYLHATPIKPGNPRSPYIPENEPDVITDDLAFRNLRRDSTSYTPTIGPVTSATESDYLHVTPNKPGNPRSLYIPKSEPDVITDDLAFRNLRRDSSRETPTTPTTPGTLRSPYIPKSESNINTNILAFRNLRRDSPKENPTIDNNNDIKTVLSLSNRIPAPLRNDVTFGLRKKRAVRSLSANLYGLINREAVFSNDCEEHMQPNPIFHGSKNDVDVGRWNKHDASSENEDNPSKFKSGRHVVSDTESSSPRMHWSNYSCTPTDCDVDINGNRPKNAFQRKLQVFVPKGDKRREVQKRIDLVPSLGGSEQNQREEKESKSRASEPFSESEISRYKQLCQDLENLVQLAKGNGVEEEKIKETANEELTQTTFSSNKDFKLREAVTAASSGNTKLKKEIVNLEKHQKNSGEKLERPCERIFTVEMKAQILDEDPAFCKDGRSSSETCEEIAAILDRDLGNFLGNKGTKQKNPENQGRDSIKPIENLRLRNEAVEKSSNSHVERNDSGKNEVESMDKSVFWRKNIFNDQTCTVEMKAQMPDEKAAYCKEDDRSSSGTCEEIAAILDNFDQPSKANEDSHSKDSITSIGENISELISPVTERVESKSQNLENDDLETTEDDTNDKPENWREKFFYNRQFTVHVEPRELHENPVFCMENERSSSETCDEVAAILDNLIKVDDDAAELNSENYSTTENGSCKPVFSHKMGAKEKDVLFDKIESKSGEEQQTKKNFDNELLFSSNGKNQCGKETGIPDEPCNSPEGSPRRENLEAEVKEREKRTEECDFLEEEGILSGSERNSYEDDEGDKSESSKLFSNKTRECGEENESWNWCSTNKAYQSQRSILGSAKIGDSPKREIVTAEVKECERRTEECDFSQGESIPSDSEINSSKSDGGDKSESSKFFSKKTNESGENTESCKWSSANETYQSHINIFGSGRTGDSLKRENLTAEVKEGEKRTEERDSSRKENIPSDSERNSSKSDGGDKSESSKFFSKKTNESGENTESCKWSSANETYQSHINILGSGRTGDSPKRENLTAEVKEREKRTEERDSPRKENIPSDSKRNSSKSDGGDKSESSKFFSKKTNESGENTESCKWSSANETYQSHINILGSGRTGDSPKRENLTAEVKEREKRTEERDSPRKENIPSDSERNSSKSDGGDKSESSKFFSKKTNESGENTESCNWSSTNEAYQSHLNILGSGRTGDSPKRENLTAEVKEREKRTEERDSSQKESIPSDSERNSIKSDGGDKSESSRFFSKKTNESGENTESCKWSSANETYQSHINILGSGNIRDSPVAAEVKKRSETVERERRTEESNFPQGERILSDSKKTSCEDGGGDKSEASKSEDSSRKATTCEGAYQLCKGILLSE